MFSKSFSSHLCYRIAAFLLSAVIFSGCYYDNEVLLYGNTGAVSCDTIQAKYSTEVSVIMSSNCTLSGCHNNVSAAGGVILDTYSQVYAARTRVLQRAVVEKTMPPGGALTQTRQNQIKCWINGGAPNN